MTIPDFSTPSKDCFLTVDKNGKQIKSGDTLVSCTHQLRGVEQKEIRYLVTNYNEHLVVIVKPSHLLNYFVQAHCEIS